MRTAPIVGVLLCSLLTGCTLTSTTPASPAAGVPIQGTVHGGQQPIVGAHLYLFAANTNGYGGASISLLNASTAGHSDSLGAYVTSDNNGGFSITGDYSCSPGSQVYIYGAGGNPGAGVNSALGLLAILGPCPDTGNFLAATPFVSINEVSTVAAAYAFAGFATDATHVSSSGTPLAKRGIANAFANAANLADLAAGTALAVTPAGNGTVPQSKINTLADILASCVNSTGPSSSPCSTLLRSTLTSDSNRPAPTETASAAINIAHNPGSNMNALFPLVSATPPFVPSLASRPNDFSIGLTFTGGGISTTSSPAGIAIDAAGNAWITNSQGNSVTELSSTGVAISPATGFTGGGLSVPVAIAIDLAGNAWSTNHVKSVSEFSSAGQPISPDAGFTGGGLLAPSAIAIDGSGDVWVTNYGVDGGIAELSNSGVPLSPSSGFTDRGSVGLSFWGVAIDTSGDAWVTLAGGNNLVAELSNSGAPISPGNGYGGGGLYIPHAIAIDSSANVWVANAQSLTKFSSAGVALSSPPGFTGSGVISDSILVSGLAIDGGGDAWVGLFGGVTELSPSGALLLTHSGVITEGVTGGPRPVAIDGSGNVWATNVTSVLEYIGSAVPVVTPLSAGVKNHSLGSRP